MMTQSYKGLAFREITTPDFDHRIEQSQVR